MRHINAYETVTISTVTRWRNFDRPSLRLIQVQIMSRKILVEVNPSVDYLGAVLREMRWRSQEENCKDPYLQRVFEKRQNASPYRYTRGRGSWSFRFDITGRRHHKGAVYLVSNGLLRKIDRDVYGKQNEWGDRSHESISEIEMPDLDDLTPEILLNSLRDLEVIEVMES